MTIDHPSTPLRPADDSSCQAGILPDHSGLAKIQQADKHRAWQLMEKSPLAFQIHDATGILRKTNRQWQDLWKTTEEKLNGRFNILRDAQYIEIGIENFFHRALAGESLQLPDFEYDPSRSGLPGRKRWIRSHLFTLEGPGKPAREVVISTMDITACILCEERYHVVVDNANEAIMVVQDGLLKFFNDKALHIAGYSDKEDYAGKPFIDFVHPDHREEMTRRHERRVAGKKVDNFYQVKIVHKDGSDRWLQVNALKMDWEGRPASLAFLYDITEHKKTEQELDQYRMNLETMVKKRTAELERALQEVKTLKGLIPVCISCKNIRDDKGYWKLMEDYLRCHSDADITHGLCPECAIRLYPHLFKTPQDLLVYQRLSQNQNPASDDPTDDES